MQLLSPFLWINFSFLSCWWLSVFFPFSLAKFHLKNNKVKKLHQENNLKQKTCPHFFFSLFWVQIEFLIGWFVIAKFNYQENQNRSTHEGRYFIFETIKSIIKYTKSEKSILMFSKIMQQMKDDFFSSKKRDAFDMLFFWKHIKLRQYFTRQKYYHHLLI